MMNWEKLSKSQKQCLRHLRMGGVPAVLVQLVALCCLAGLIEGLPTLDSVEYFAGMMAITNSLIFQGFIAEAFELKQDPLNCDIMSRTGYAYAISLVMRLHPGSMCWCQPPHNLEITFVDKKKNDASLGWLLCKQQQS